MKKYFITILLAFAITGNPVYAARDTATASLNPIMTDIGKAMLDLYPLIVAQREFTERDVAHISESLAKLSKLFRQAQPYIDERSDAYQISYEFISRYLEVLKTILETSHVDYARSYLHALGEICTSCHTQDTTLRTLFRGTTRKDFASDYAFAELNYMTRDYQKAVNYYEKYLMSPQRKTELNVIQPLQRIVTIYTQIENRPAEGAGILQKYTSLKQHTPETREALEGWIQGLKALQSDHAGNSEVTSFETLQSYVARYLGDTEKLSLHIESTPKQEVLRIWLRGQLYHYLNRQPPGSEVPMLLYWLSVTDRSIAYNFYFSLADLYLRQCVLKYPDHPYARRCYAEYKHYVDYTYQRQGEEIPSGIAQEIQEMQKALSHVKKN